MIRSLLLSVSFILCSIACGKTTPANEKQQITEKVNQLYSQYGKSNEAVYNKPIANDLFSPELKKTLEDAINASKADIEKVKNSDHPDEKPLAFEGALFSSLYEGYNGYSIKNINLHDKTAEVLVQFEYNMVSPKVLWTDKIYFVNIDNTGWRIDNITFDKKLSNSKDLKSSLTDFTQYSKQ